MMTVHSSAVACPRTMSSAKAMQVGAPQDPQSIPGRLALMDSISLIRRYLLTRAVSAAAAKPMQALPRMPDGLSTA